MGLFEDALFVTLGIVTGLAFLWMAFNTSKLLFAMWVYKKRTELNEAVDEERAARLALAKDRWANLALEELKNPEIKDILEALRTVPYVDKRTKAAKKQNYQRQKLQNKLRKYIADPNVRGVIYDMAA